MEWLDIVSSYDNFTDGDLYEFLRKLKDHFSAKDENKRIFAEKTGHTYQMKDQEVADLILKQIKDWRCI